jgi:hypothetical protein
MTSGERSRVEEYRQKADEADKLSQRSDEAGNLTAAQTYRDIARKWRELAEKAERWGI